MVSGVRWPGSAVSRLNPAVGADAAALPRRVHLLGWASLFANTGIVATGGAVRLTGSGLGCPTWPTCTQESWVATPEMGLHGVIEFGNRLLTFVLVAVAAATFLALWRYRQQRPELLRMSFAIGIGIIVQAGVGGLTVLFDLNPNIVGVHYLISAVLVGIAATLVYRIRTGPKPIAQRPPPRPLLVVTTALMVVSGISIVMGVLTTGAGPHSGDPNVARNDLDAALMQHLHAWPGYIMVALTVVLLVLASRLGYQRMARYVSVLLVLEAIQVAVGVIQSRTGLPIGLVGIHMVLACIIVAALVWTWHAMRRPVPAPSEHQPDPGHGSPAQADRPSASAPAP